MSKFTLQQVEEHRRKHGFRPLLAESVSKTPAPVAGIPKYRMNKTETELYGILKKQGYDRVEFEAITLTLATGARYTPDFYCYSVSKENLVSTPTFYEAKGGFIREASLVRLKVAARQYPEFQFILAQKKNGTWSEKMIQS